jgi:hypothetical protein
MKKIGNPELTQTINRQAHMLAAQSFAVIRMQLEEQARALLKEGKGLDETLRAVRAMGIHHGLPEL